MASGTIKRSNTVNGTLDATQLAGTGLSEHGTCAICKNGSVVQLTLVLKATGNSPFYVYGTYIPSGFLPKQQVNFIAGDGTSTGQSIGKITPTGAITIYVGSGGYVEGTITYLTD